jgi:RNA polymerase sigma-70 factor (ECF subfamily)
LPRLPSLRDLRSFGAWLASIARNCANDYHRHGVAEVEFDEETQMEATSTGDATDGNAEARSILMTVRTLPEAYRETLLLRLVEGMTGPEIAARTGLTPGSVRVNLHRGMHLLREKLVQPGTGKRSTQSETGSQASGAAKETGPHE